MAALLTVDSDQCGSDQVGQKMKKGQGAWRIRATEGLTPLLRLVYSLSGVRR
jgi:hypothetical protein